MGRFIIMAALLALGCNNNLGNFQDIVAKFQTKEGSSEYTFPSTAEEREFDLVIFNSSSDKDAIGYKVDFSFSEDPSSDHSSDSRIRKDPAKNPLSNGYIEYIPENEHEYESGASYTLFVPEKDNMHEITATVVSLKQNSVILVEKSLLSDKVRQRIEEIAKTFERIIFPRATALFGHPSDINGDGRVTILFTKFKNEYLGGFFSHLDLFPKDKDNPDPQPNLQEIFYVSLDRKNEVLLENLSHELQHLLFFSNKYMEKHDETYRLKLDIPFEEKGINEGLSHLAEDLVGFGDSLPIPVSYFYKYFSEYPLSYASDDDLDRSLTARGGNYLLFRYMIDRIGGGKFNAGNIFENEEVKILLASIITSKKSGYINLVDGFNEIMGSHYDLSDLLADFYTSIVYAGQKINNPKFTFAQRQKDQLTGFFTGPPLSGSFVTTSDNKVELIPPKGKKIHGDFEGRLGSLAANQFRITLPKGDNHRMKISTGNGRYLSYIVLKKLQPAKE